MESTTGEHDIATDREVAVIRCKWHQLKGKLSWVVPCRESGAHGRFMECAMSSIAEAS